MKIKNEVGNKFGKLTVIGESTKRDKSGKIYWVCKCECGNIKEYRANGLRSGQIKSCGCNRIKNEVGNKFGKLTVIGESTKRDKSGVSFWVCECECGNIKEIKGTSLRNGQTKSCGCMMGGESTIESAYKHLFNSLKSGAKKRKLSFNVSYKFFKKIVHENCYICGEKPKQKRFGYTKRRYSQNNDVFVYIHSLDRINNALGYEENNVKPCCLYCNRMKNDLTLNEFYERINKIYKKWKEN